MSLRKPMLKVTKECSRCKGSGGKYPYVTVECPRCKGNGRIDVKQNDPKFKKYYQKTLEQRVDDLTTEYRNAKAETFDIGEELRKYCKELDKVVNK